MPSIQRSIRRGDHNTLCRRKHRPPDVDGAADAEPCVRHRSRPDGDGIRGGNVAGDDNAMGVAKLHHASAGETHCTEQRSVCPGSRISPWPENELHGWQASGAYRASSQSTRPSQ